MKFKLIIFFCLMHVCLVRGQQRFSVFYERNKHELDAAQNLRLNEWIKTNPEIKIVAIHGYTDEDGTTGFNDTLAGKRVNTIYNAVMGKVKIRDDFKTRNFGEKFPQSKNKAENRKVDIFYLEQKDFPRENEILGIQEETLKPALPKKFPEKIVVRNPNGTETEYTLNAGFMQKIDEAKAGEKVKLENLNFVINTFAVVPESRGKMYELLIVLEANPKLKIDIQGHLCCMPIDRIDLSTQRAKAIYNFLVGNKISKSRLSYKGFGSTEPIYPLPEKSEDERSANRRVEILIVEN